MKELNLYVEELLNRHQCVIIPEFGALISNVNPAELINDTITPPSRKLTFNSMLSYDDGLLCKYISSVENISYDRAKELVRAKVNQWMEELQQGKELEFKNLGTFKKTPHHNYVLFEDAQDGEVVNKQFFGMDTVSIDKKEAEVVDYHEDKEEQEQIVSSAVSENPLTSENEKAVDIEQGSTEKKKSSFWDIDFEVPEYVKYIIYSVVGLALILAGFSALKQKSSNGEETQMSVVEADPAIVSNKVDEYVAQTTFMEDSPINAETVVISANKDAKMAKKIAEHAKQQQTATQQATNSGSSDTNNAAVRGNYYLIAGAFSTEQNAQSMVNQLKEEGFGNAVIVGKNDKGLILVAYDVFESKAKAAKKSEELKIDGYDTWLYSK